MTNVINFLEKKQAKTSGNNDSELQQFMDSFLSESFTTREKTDFIKKVKELLKARGIDYRISHKELPELDKKYTLLFTKAKIAFSFSVDKKNTPPSGWLLTPLIISNKLDPIVSLGHILKAIGGDNGKAEANNAK